MGPILEIGRIHRAHGLRGDVSVSLVTDRVDRLAPGSVLDADGRRLTVDSARPDRGRWLVRFTDVVDRGSAEGLAGLVLRAVSEGPADDDALWVHELIGAEVRDVGGAVHGVVAEVQANPAADLLVLDDGRLVPMTFVTGLTDGVVTVDAPSGLFAL